MNKPHYLWIVEAYDIVNQIWFPINQTFITRKEARKHIDKHIINYGYVYKVCKYIKIK